MDAKKNSLRRQYGPANSQAGSTAIEFALIAIVFFIFIFGVLELGRAMYIFNTLQEITRRAAAVAVNSNFDQNTLKQISAQALFPNKQGNMILGAPITPAHLRIELLSVSRDSATGALSMQPISSLPACPATNRLNCLADPYGASCIRFVRVQICDVGEQGTCTRVPYQTLFSLVNLSLLKLPRATTIAPAQSLGYQLGAMPCE